MTFRPRWGRVVPYVLAVIVIAGFTVVALSLTSQGKGGAKALDRVMLIVFALVVAYGLHRFASVRVRADQQGVLVRNIVHTRRLEWAEVVSVRLAPGDPWVQLDLADGTTLAAMGIQGADGEYGRAQAARLEALVARPPE